MSKVVVGAVGIRLRRPTLARTEPGAIAAAVNAPKVRARQARETLKRAAAAVEDALGPRPETDRTVEKLLSGTQWTIVDAFESDGKRYVLVREDTGPNGASALLTKRENQVVEHIRLGESSKVVAYALGISDSTVRVLLGRCYAKLGLHRRADLLTEATTVTASSRPRTRLK